MMIQEEAKNQCGDVIKETCFQLLCEALFLIVIKKKKSVKERNTKGSVRSF